jgi:hypothetical protein
LFTLQRADALLGRFISKSERREPNVEGRKAELLQRIESDREVLLHFFRNFIRCLSPNPPGDTREAAAHVRQFLANHDANCRVIAPNAISPLAPRFRGVISMSSVLSTAGVARLPQPQ